MSMDPETPANPEPPAPQQAPPKFSYGKPEKTKWVRLITMAVIIVAGISAIVWMVKIAPRQHELKCTSVFGNATDKLHSFGTCKEE
jgi:hypothetical protein